MKRLLLLFCSLLVIYSCSKKDNPKPTTKITYRIESNTDTAYLGIEVGVGSETHPGVNNWIVKGRGDFDTTLTVEIGSNVFMRCWNASSEWKIVIKGANKDVLAEGRADKFEPGTPYDPAKGYQPGNAYHSRIIRATAK